MFFFKYRKKHKVNTLVLLSKKEKIIKNNKKLNKRILKIINETLYLKIHFQNVRITMLILYSII
jgi:hypothetical protein